MIMTGSLFKSEAEFEKALINTLKNKGWKGDVFYRPTEKDLIENWKKIIFENNRDVLHGVPLSDSEMDQILKQVDSSPLPLDKNLFINGSSMSILRDNPEAPQLSEYVSLVIFDHNQKAAIKSPNSLFLKATFPKRKEEISCSLSMGCRLFTLN